MTAATTADPRSDLQGQTAKATLTPSELRAAAKRADARAAEARNVADHAKKIAMQARKAAAKESSAAAKLRDEAKPLRADASPSLAQAKTKLLETAKSIDPIGTARAAVKDHPFATVGISAGAGAVLGGTGGLFGNLLGSAVRLSTTLIGLARPAMMAYAKYAAAQAVAGHAAPAGDAGPASDPAAAPMPPG